MDFSLTEEQRLLQSEIRRFASEELNQEVSRRDRDQEFPRELWRRCGEMGLMGLPVPEQEGGSGLEPLSTAIALEALGYGCEDSGLVFSICAHLLAGVVPLWKFGTETQRNRYLAGLCDGSLIAANAMTEADSGSDAFALRTSAREDGDGYRINGTKMFITNAPVADLALVFACTDPDRPPAARLTAFLVETGTAGFQVGRKLEKMGLRTSPLSELVFEDVRVSRDAVLGGVGGGAMVFTHSMDWERTCLFASHVGTAERLLETAVRYARNRRQSGQAIGKFQGVAHRIADAKVALEGARWLVYHAAWQLERTRRVSLHAAIAKLAASRALLRCALDAVQVLGGYGFMTEFQVERAVRDAVGSGLYSGTSEIQKNIIAGWLGL